MRLPPSPSGRRSAEHGGEIASGGARSDAYPEVPWHSVVGMRHRLVHRYCAVDEDIVWQTLMTELEPLLRGLERVSEAE